MAHFYPSVREEVRPIGFDPFDWVNREVARQCRFEAGFLWTDEFPGLTRWLGELVLHVWFCEECQAYHNAMCGPTSTFANDENFEHSSAAVADLFAKLSQIFSEEEFDNLLDQSYTEG
jgi:hypothetical protein